MRDLINHQVKTPNFLTRLLWRAAGADDRILERSTYSDHVKYASIGGIICFTALLAGVSAGFAIFSIFSQKPVGNEVVDNTGVTIAAVAFSIIWGIMIYNLDRFIVSATGKGDGKEGISWYDLSLGWPRLLMALIIGLVISAPLEIKIMEPEIEQQLKIAERATLKSKQDQIINNIDEQYSVILKEISDKDSILKVKEKDRADTDLSRRQHLTNRETVGRGPVVINLEKQIEVKDKDISATKDDIKKLKDSENYKKYLEDKETLIKSAKGEIANGSGLMSRLILAEQFASGYRYDDKGELTKGKEDDDHSIIPWFIRLFFIVLEVTPVLTKMMLVKSPYDYLEENLGEIVKAKEAIEIRHDFLKDENGKLLTKAVNYVPLQMIKEQQEVLLAQEQVSQEIIDEWKNREKQNIKDNLDDYLIK